MPESTRLQKVKSYVATMPSLPTSVTKVLEVCNNPKTSPIDLDRIIKLDPVLMGRVLKLINSAYYGLGNQITSLSRAIIMLGINTVKNLALSSAVLDRVSGHNHFRALNLESFWLHSLCVGVASKLIAKELGVDSKQLEEYFAAGLLHDIGKIPINTALADDFVFAMSMADKERISIYRSEREVLDLDHCEAGSIVADIWKLSGAIADTIAWHHRLDEYEGSHFNILGVIALADSFAIQEEIGFSGNRFPDKISPRVFDELHLDKNILDDLRAPLDTEIEKAKVFLKLSSQ